MNFNFLYTFVILIILGFLGSVCGYFGYFYYTQSFGSNWTDNNILSGKNNSKYEQFDDKAIEIEKTTPYIFEPRFMDSKSNLSNVLVTFENNSTNNSVINQNDDLISFPSLFNTSNIATIYNQIKDKMDFVNFNTTILGKIEQLSLITDENELISDLQFINNTEFEFIAYEDTKFIIITFIDLIDENLYNFVNFIDKIIQSINFCSHTNSIMQKFISTVIINEFVVNFLDNKNEDLINMDQVNLANYSDFATKTFFVDQYNKNLKIEFNINYENNNIYGFSFKPVIKKDINGCDNCNNVTREYVTMRENCINSQKQSLNSKKDI